VIIFLTEGVIDENNLGLYHIKQNHLHSFYLIDDKLDVYAKISIIEDDIFQVMSSEALKGYSLDSSIYDIALSFIYPKFLESDGATSDEATVMYKRWFKNENIVKKKLSHDKYDNNSHRHVLNYTYQGSPYDKTTIDKLIEKGENYANNSGLSKTQVRKNIITRKIN